jgi:cell division protein FtsQ
MLALAGAWLWVRDSPLVAVQRVTIVGASGPEAGQIQAALQAAAHGMTTLDVNMGSLRTAVAPFPVVKDLQVSTAFPHGLRIRVIEQIPVAVVTAAGGRIAVAGDGTLLRGASPSPSLPVIPIQAVPGGARLTDAPALAVLAVLGAAPYQLLAHVGGASDTPAHGVVVDLRSGPNVYFGDAQELDAKWTAAAAVLASSGSAGATYIDVTNPVRPAAGGR